MGRMLWRGGLIVVAALLLAGAARGAHRDSHAASEIRSALSAAPAAVAAHAAVAAFGKDGKLTELRRGTNGWTCLTPDAGDPQPRPACFDANGLAFVEAYAAGRAPDPGKPGFSYMLQGGSAWSNTDPWATRLPAGEKDFIHIPPHIMILDARAANASGLPSGEAHPDTRRPFVLFGGTRYAMVIIPVR